MDYEISIANLREAQDVRNHMYTYGAAIRDHYTDELISAAFELGGIYVATDYNGKVVGALIALQTREAYQDCTRFLWAFVLPEYRGQGLYKKLVDRAIEGASGDNIHFLGPVANHREMWLERGFQFTRPTGDLVYAYRSGV